MEGNIDVLSYAGHQSGRSGSVFSFCCRFGKKKSIKLPSETSVERRCSLFSVKTPVCAPKTELGCLNPQNKPCVSRFSRPCYKHRKQISTQPAGAGRSTNTLTPFFQLWKTELNSSACIAWFLEQNGRTWNVQINVKNMNVNNLQTQTSCCSVGLNEI